MIKTIYSNQQEQLRVLLRKLRLQAGLRQADLAKRLEVPQSFVSKYESGERRLDFLEVRQICDALDISMSKFIRRFEDALKSPPL